MFNIWASLLSIVNSIIGVLLSLFPVADSNIIYSITNSKTQFLSSIATLNWFFPVDTFLSFLGIVLVVELLMLNTKLAHWLLRIFSFGLIK